jgi:hypothetical protein
VDPAEPHPYSPALAAVLLDALFPSLYAVQSEPVPVPTAEITAHVAPTGSPGVGAQRAVWAAPGLCLDDAELWTAEADSWAQARQLRRILRQPASNSRTDRLARRAALSPSCSPPAATNRRITQ